MQAEELRHPRQQEETGQGENEMSPSKESSGNDVKKGEEGLATSIKKLSKEEVLQLQKKLSELGYNPGQADGLWGKKTETALKKFQEDQNLVVSGKVDEETWQELGL